MTPAAQASGPGLDPDSAWHWLIHPFRVSPVFTSDGHLMTSRPLAPLLFDNESSDARDHCANERTFLSWLRLSVYMAVVGVAIVITFHLVNEPSELERRAALPLGLIFWVLSLACLASGLHNYLSTVGKYARRKAIVQTDWKTSVVFTVVAATIVAACILFITNNATQH